MGWGGGGQSILRRGYIIAKFAYMLYHEQLNS